MRSILKLKIYDYKYKNDKSETPHVGVVAQDLKKVFPNAVRKNDDGYLEIRQEDMFYAMLNAIKDLDKRITDQNEIIDKQAYEINRLKKEIEKLK